MVSNKTELKELMVRRLGGDAHDVEITPEMWEDIIYTAYREWRMYSADGHTEAIYVWDGVEASSSFKLDESILTVKDIKEVSASVNGSGIDTMFDNPNYYVPVKMESLFNTNGLQTNSMALFQVKQDMDTARSMMRGDKVHYDYNGNTKKLAILSADKYKQLTMYVVKAEPIDDCLNDENLQMLIESKALKQWARLLGLKYNQENAQIMGNGLSLNIGQMNDEADALYEHYRERLEEYELDTLIPLMII